MLNFSLCVYCIHV
ncbi:CPXV216 protein [Cowpox virus]|uniref:CPXV216 protein n=1 Tax=Cowpox virus TaxID=10243 RepID=A0A290GMM4_COWPX|nr:CPXV216 protein [Cowpox virus]ATB55481.1 CPXV216 protein [Cowpox virus]ATB55695.1 CPXV216 protein [Cowpox virus]ATB55910.1 CPXV216 protein [Cowpox virus]ATB56125.1 CPXV216 protein [Cowpox virus]